MEFIEYTFQLLIEDVLNIMDVLNNDMTPAIC
jgi:hypothetical protein